MASDGRPLSAAGYLKAARVLHAIGGDPAARARFAPVRLVLLASFTTQLLDAVLKVEAAEHGFLLDVHHGGFGQFEQELLGDAWRAKAEGVPEVLVVMMRVEDLHPEVGTRGAGLAEATADVLARIEATLALFRERSRGPALVASFSVPEPRVASVFDANQPGSIVHAYEAANRALLARVHAVRGAVVWDYAGLVASAGRARWTDPRMWALARNPIAPVNQPLFAQHLARTLRGVMRPASKCLVLDLDNTLWGGVLGDDGLSGIQLGDEHPGRAFKDFQRAVLGLRDRGIVLAIASKNDPAAVEEALASHPEMRIRPKDVAVTRASWGPKSVSLREIAAELEIGTDSLVFFDDNPVERAEVRAALPDVHVVEVPADPALYVHALADVPVFDVPTVTAEDRLRAESYVQQAERKKAERASGSLEDFLASLGMEAEIGAFGPVTAGRVAQLVAKTNQFNTTTRRLGEAELAALHDAGPGVHGLRLADRYGDLGLVGVTMLRAEGRDAVVHGLVLSCRVANRGIEQTMLAFCAERARAEGFTGLVGELVPSKKNAPVMDLYPRLGFVPLGEADGVQRFRLDLASTALAVPPYVRLRVT
jgi:FkbH-like protein